MVLEAICFTERGMALGERLSTCLPAGEIELRLTRGGKGGPSLAQWTAERFPAADGLLFIGAAGIAVRAISPFVAAKTSDPAVLVMDEGGGHVIPILSGHIGGANALALCIAKLLGAGAVITTATDVSGVFAADTWATERGYHIRNPRQIKDVSALLLAGERVGFYSAFPVEGPLPNGLFPVDSEEEAGLSITVAGEGNGKALRLTPPALVLGVGCRRGTDREAIEAFFAALCAEENLHPSAFSGVYSIDLKKDEPGLLAFCQRRNLPFTTFAAAELAAATGEYTPSSFVEQTTGVDNVCERSAAMGSGGTIIIKKRAGKGVTMAVARIGLTIHF